MKAYLVDTIPQNIHPFEYITLKQVIDAFPDEGLPFNFSLGVTKPLKFGKQIGTVNFVAQLDGHVPMEVQQYIHDRIMQATEGKHAASVLTNWRGGEVLYLFANGRKIVSEVELGRFVYTEIPPMTDLPIWIPSEYITQRICGLDFSKELAKYENMFIYECGGGPRQGGSFNDADFVVGKIIRNEETFEATLVAQAPGDLCKVIKSKLTEAINHKVGVNEPHILKRFINVDVGSTFMENKGDLYFCERFDSTGAYSYKGA